MTQDLTAREAAARLGVKRATLYAYVSRGVLTRRMAPDGRTSLFDAAEIDRLRAGRRRRAEGELESVLATGLTDVGDHGLRVRGADPVRLLGRGAGFEELVEHLLGAEGLDWELPAALERAVRKAVGALPAAASFLDRYRVATAVVSALDPLRFDLDPGAVRPATPRLLGALVTSLEPLGRVPADRRLAARLWPRLTATRGNAARRRALDVALGLLVDHGLATSTFGARVAASVRADPYSVVSAGLGVVAGPLHGASSGAVHRLLAEVHELDDPGPSLGEARRRLGHFPGFGHAVYRRVDPRFAPLRRALAEAWPGDPRLGTVEALRRALARHTDLAPNVDLALGALTWCAGMAPEAGEALFALARTAGWIAHGLEEYGEAPLRFRPRARYVGPTGD